MHQNDMQQGTDPRNLATSLRRRLELEGSTTTIDDVLVDGKEHEYTKQNMLPVIDQRLPWGESVRFDIDDEAGMRKHGAQQRQLGRIHISSKDRDITAHPSANKFTIYLSPHLRDVFGFKLVYASIPIISTDVHYYYNPLLPIDLTPGHVQQNPTLLRRPVYSPTVFLRSTELGYMTQMNNSQLDKSRHTDFATNGFCPIPLYESVRRPVQDFLAYNTSQIPNGYGTNVPLGGYSTPTLCSFAIFEEQANHMTAKWFIPHQHIVNKLTFELVVRDEGMNNSDKDTDFIPANQGGATSSDISRLYRPYPLPDESFLSKIDPSYSYPGKLDQNNIELVFDVWGMR